MTSDSTFQACLRRRAIEDLAIPTCAATNMATLAYSEGIIDPKHWETRESIPPGACHGVGVGLIWFGAGSGSSLSDDPKYEYRNGKLYQRITAWQGKNDQANKNGRSA